MKNKITPTEEILINAADRAARNHGPPDLIFMPPSLLRSILEQRGDVFTDFEWEFYLDLLEVSQEPDDILKILR